MGYGTTVGRDVWGEERTAARECRGRVDPHGFALASEFDGGTPMGQFHGIRSRGRTPSLASSDVAGPARCQLPADKYGACTCGTGMRYRSGPPALKEQKSAPLRMLDRGDGFGLTACLRAGLGPLQAQ